MKKQIPLTPVLAVALAILVAVAWFALISPKRARGAALDGEKADLETKIALASKPQENEGGPAVVEIDVADIFRLAKAMPDREDMSGILLELDAVSTAAGVEFLSIQPGATITYAGYYATPVTLTFSGSYYDLTDFLFRLRNLVSVRDGVLEANGRLYTLDAIDFEESEEGFPRIDAVLTVSAYSFGVPVTPGAPPPATTGETTTGETTTGETTTAPSEGSENASPQAAGGTP